MKKALFILILFLTLDVYSQEYWDYNINFDDSSQFFRITIDTTINPNNIWQIGVPQKTIFNNAYSLPNVIVTDTINSYLPNDTSTFFITHIANDGFIWPHTVILSGYYKSDSDSLSDYGIIEFSPDNGETWIDLLNDTIYNQYLEWQTQKPILTGRVTEWTHFYVNLAQLGNIFNINYGDTLYYKFSFISDGEVEQMDGLMYDNLHFEDWWETIYENTESFFKSKVYPSPAKLSLTIEYENLQNHSIELTILDINGNVVLSKENVITNQININTEKLVSGLYLYKLTNPKTKKQSTGKFVIKK